MSRPLLLGTLGLVLTGLAGCSSGTSTLDGRFDDGYYGALLPTSTIYTLPRVSLVDQDGSPYDLATDPTTPLTLVFFGYTHCPDVCGQVMASLASAMTRLDVAQRRQVRVWFVTTDPARDTVRVLHDYVRRFDPTFQGLTGPIGDISRLGDSMDVVIEKGRRLASGGYDVTHGASVIGLDAQHRGTMVWTQGTSSAQFAADIEALLEKADA